MNTWLAGVFLLALGCAAERRCAFSIGCESSPKNRPVFLDIPPQVLAAAACKVRGDRLIADAGSCERMRQLLEHLVATDPDCAAYRDAGDLLWCPG